MANTENTEELNQMNELAKNKADFESRFGTNGTQPRSQYIIHSEVICVGKEHLVMICVERI